MAQEKPEDKNVAQEEQPEEVEDLTTAAKAEQSEATNSKESEEAMVAGVEAVGKVSLIFKKLTKPFRWWWAKKKFSIPITLVLLIGLGAGVWASPLRYDVMNIYSTATLSVIVVNEDTDAPISGVAVIADENQSITDNDGMATIEGVRFGDTEIVMKKSAYETYRRAITVEKSPTDLGMVRLEPTGITIELKVNDALSEKPVAGATVSYQDLSAQTDKSGLAQLVIPTTSDREIAVSITQNGYNSFEGKISVDGSSEIELLPSGRNLFFSNRSGSIDLYSIKLDGSDEKIELKGTGNETKNVSMSISPDGKWAAIVSTRDGTRDDDGAVQPELFILNLSDGTLTKADEGASNFSLQGWANGKIVYSVWLSDEEFDSNKRYKLKTYDPEATSLNTIRSSNDLNVIALIGNDILFTHRDYDVRGNTLVSSTPEGAVTNIISGKDIYFYNSEQISTSKLLFSLEQYGQDTSKSGVYEYDALTDEATKLENRPPNVTVRRTITSQNNVNVAWVETRDGKDRLLVADSNGENERIVTSRGNISYPLKWIGDDIVIFRVNSDDETADYVMNVNSDVEPQKITDVFTRSYNYSRYY